MGLLGEECNALLGQATHMMKTIRLVLLGFKLGHRPSPLLVITLLTPITGLEVGN